MLDFIGVTLNLSVFAGKYWTLKIELIVFRMDLMNKKKKRKLATNANLKHTLNSTFNEKKTLMETFENISLLQETEWSRWTGTNSWVQGSSQKTTFIKKLNQQVFSSKFMHRIFWIKWENCWKFGKRLSWECC